MNKNNFNNNTSILILTNCGDNLVGNNSNFNTLKKVIQCTITYYLLIAIMPLINRA